MHSKLIGILGGTFDPVHFGHLRMARELCEQLTLTEVRFIPCKNPVHKITVFASAEDRLAMLKLAIKDEPDFIIDECELIRHTPSYMVTTLINLKNNFPDNHLCLLLGADAFAQICSWHSWQDIFQLAHLVVVNRPHYTEKFSAAVLALIKQREAKQLKELYSTGFGKIYLANTTLLNISSTAIRLQISKQKSSRFLLPDAVLNCINKHKIYANK